MLNRLIYNTFIVSLLLTSGLSADPGDKLTLQLLVDDRGIEMAKHATRTQDLSYPHAIPHPHVSFIQIEDKQNILRQNFGEVMQLATTILENYRTILKERSQELTFLGQGITGYPSQANGVTYWCLEDADKHNGDSNPNKLFKFVAQEVKTALEKLILEKSEENKVFSLKTPGQIVQGMAEQTRKASLSSVGFSRGFPHMSLAKGSDLNPALFSEAQNVTIPLAITGINAVFTYQGSTSENPIPQVYIKQYFGSREVELSSQFNCLSNYNGLYSNLQSLLGEIEGLDSSYIRSEIQQLANLKKQRLNSDLTMNPSDLALSEKEEEKKLNDEIERLQKYIDLQKNQLGKKANATKRKREDELN